MKDRITNTITRHIGVISESSRGWKLELNMVSWNGAEPKLDIHDWSPDHQRCNNRGTFTREESDRIVLTSKKLRGIGLCCCTGFLPDIIHQLISYIQEHLLFLF